MVCELYLNKAIFKTYSRKHTHKSTTSKTSAKKIPSNKKYKEDILFNDYMKEEFQGIKYNEIQSSDNRIDAIPLSNSKNCEENKQENIIDITNTEKETTEEIKEEIDIYGDDDYYPNGKELIIPYEKKDDEKYKLLKCKQLKNPSHSTYNSAEKKTQIKYEKDFKVYNQYSILRKKKQYILHKNYIFPVYL